MEVEINGRIFKSKFALFWYCLKLNLKGLMPIYRKIDKINKEIVKLQSVDDDVLEAKKVLDQELNEVNKGHQLIRRLASLETRITQLEISQHGCGEEAPRSFGEDQD